MDSLAAALPIPLEGANVRCGTCSWADRSLTREGGWYPRKTMRAAERLAFYASRFPVVEIDSTLRFPPTPEVARQWAERTPPEFRFDVRGWSLLTGASALPTSLWPDLATAVREDMRDRRRLYAKHLTDEAVEECWRRFAHALRPLHDAGRLGVVIFEYPHWFHPKDENYAELVAVKTRMGDLPVAVEFTSNRWFANQQCETTLELLETNEIGFVCSDWVDAEEAPVVAATANTSVIRFHGRSDAWGYRYDSDELRPWLDRIRDLARSSNEVHVLFDTAFRDAAVRNAELIQSLLAAVKTSAALLA